MIYKHIMRRIDCVPFHECSADDQLNKVLAIQKLRANCLAEHKLNFNNKPKREKKKAELKNPVKQKVLANKFVKLLGDMTASELKAFQELVKRNLNANN